MNILRNEMRHTWLLATLVTVEIGNPVVGRAGVVAQTLAVGLALAAAAAVVGFAMDTRAQRLRGALFIAPAVVIELTRFAAPQAWDPKLDIIADVSASVFLGYVVAIIVRHIFSARRIGVDDVIGAFAGYLMTGLMWGRLYSLVWTLDPGAFQINSAIAWQLEHWHLRHALFNYFSITTLATVGYGDITTAAPITNTLLWLEVMSGQFYLAVVVATIVGLKLAQALTNSDK
jgi:hypothetical protein